MLKRMFKAARVEQRCWSALSLCQVWCLPTWHIITWVDHQFLRSDGGFNESTTSAQSFFLMGGSLLRVELVPYWLVIVSRRWLIMTLYHSEWISTITKYIYYFKLNVTCKGCFFFMQSMTMDRGPSIQNPIYFIHSWYCNIIIVRNTLAVFHIFGSWDA